jgi:fibronectin-binding autotransporter adhesin
MKTMHNGWVRSLFATVLAVMMLAGGGGVTAYGAPANLYWDVNGATAGTGGTGPWNLTDLTWRTNSATGTLLPWDNGVNGNSAYLGGTVGTLTLGANITVAYISPSSGYVINGDAGGSYSLTFDSTSKVGGDGGVYAVMMNGGLLTINAPVVLAGSFYSQFRGDITFNGVVSGSGSLSTYTTMTLTNANTFSGGFHMVNGGYLVFTHDQALGTGAILTGGGVLRAGNGYRTISNPITPTGGGAFNMATDGTNNLTLAGGAGTGIVGGKDPRFTVNNPVLTIDRPLYGYYGQPATFVFTKAGTGTLVLAQSSPQSLGTVNINSGAVIVNGGAISNSTLTGTTTNGSKVITGLSSTAGLKVGQQVSSGVGTPPNTPVIVSIDGADQITLAEAWTATGSRSLTFSAAGGGLGYNSGHITVSNTATLGGTGTIVLATGKTNTILTGGTIAPGGIAAGTEVGTLTVTNGTFVLATNAIYAWQSKDGVGDKVRVYGTLSLPAVATVNVSQVSGALPATPTLFTANAFAGASTLSDWVVNGLTGYGAKIQGTDVVLYVLPLAITNLPAVVVDSSHAILSGKLLADGLQPPANVSVFWGPQDKGMTKAGWANTNDFGPCSVGVALNTNVVLTPPSGVYSYRFYVTNAVTEAWSDPAVTFSVEAVRLVATAPNAAELGQVPGVIMAYRSDTATNVPLQVNFTVSGTAAGGVDYGAIGTSVTILVGATNAPITITPLIDRLIEGVETVTVTLAAGSYAIGSPSVAEVTIADWAAPAYAYVATTGNGTYGTNWATAYTNVQDALNRANSNDTVYVKGETFILPLNSGNGKLVWTRSFLTLAGGYAADGGLPGALTNTPTVFANTNTPTADGDTSNRVLYVSGVTNGTLSRVTIRGGKIGPSGNASPPSPPNYYGAGVYVTGSTNLVFSSVTIEGNSMLNLFDVTLQGGGLYATNSWGTLTNCVVLNNSVPDYRNPCWGGGVYLGGGGWTLQDTVVRDNNSTLTHGNSWKGLGIAINGGTHALRNCAVARNAGINTLTSVQGDGLYVVGATVTVQNCTIAWHQYGGIRLASGTMGVTNCILWGNGGNVVANGTNDIVGVATGSVAYCDIGVGDRAFTNNGNFSSDPLFERGFYLATNSPCVNAGSQSASAAGLDGRTTRADGTADTDTVDLGYHFAGGVAVPELYVSVNSGSDANTGTAPGAGSAFKTIGKALATAGDGTHVHIEAGNYTTNSETFPLVAANKWGVQLLGASSAVTLLSAQGASNRVLTMSFCYPDARIEGFTLANARWNLGYGMSGSGGELGAMGGALYVAHVKGTVASCSITNNALPQKVEWGVRAGGGLAVTASDVLVSNCTVVANSCASYADNDDAIGAGIYSDGGTFVNCLVGGNSITGGRYRRGGGFYLTTGNHLLRNCLVYSNDAVTGGTAFGGDGLYVAGGAVVLESSTVVTNGGEGLRQAAGTVAVTNSILWGNGVDATGTVVAAYSDVGVAGPAVVLLSCLSTNPLFMFPATNNYRLAEGSPCINAGLTLSWMTGATDLGGQRRIMAGRVDMGAYEAMPPGGSVFKFR